MSNEEILAVAIADKLELDSTQGIVEFCYEIEIDLDKVATVKGWVEYETEYEESCNYLYNSYVFVNIDSIEGVNVDERRVANYIKKKLYG